VIFFLVLFLLHATVLSHLEEMIFFLTCCILSTGYTDLCKHVSLGDNSAARAHRPHDSVAWRGAAVAVLRRRAGGGRACHDYDSPFGEHSLPFHLVSTSF
jgi:hypothetical protein